MFLYYYLSGLFSNKNCQHTKKRGVRHIFDAVSIGLVIFEKQPT